MDIRLSRYDDPSFNLHVNLCTMSLDRILSLTTALALIVALVFIAMILHDLNDLWVEAEHMWEMFDDYWTIIKNQDQKIIDLQMQIISKVGVGV